jgi:hypothetical protein
MLNKKTVFSIFVALLLVIISYCQALKSEIYHDVPTLLKEMSSKDSKVSQKAYDESQKLEKSDIPAILKELENEDPLICEMAIEMLAVAIKDKESETTVLKNLLKSERNMVRIGAALRLVDIDPSLGKELIPFLIEAVKEGTPRYEVTAISILRDIGPDARDAVPSIIESMKRHPKGWNAFYYTTLRFIGTPEALEAIKPYELEKARRKKLVKPISMLVDSTIGSFLMTAVFLGLFLWSRPRRKKGKKIIYWPLLIPMFFWGIFALTSLMDQPLMSDPFIQGLYGFQIYIGLFIITMVGLITWLVSLLWRKKHTAPSAPKS